MGLTTRETGLTADIVAPTDPAQEVLFRDSADGKIKRMDSQRNVTTFDTSQAASEADAGIAKLATQAEVLAGTDTTKIVTSNLLAAKKISIIGAGKIVDAWTFIGNFRLVASQTDGTLFLEIATRSGISKILSFTIIGGFKSSGGVTLDADLVETKSDSVGVVTKTVIQSMTQQVPGADASFDVITTLGTPYQTLDGASYAVEITGTTGVAEQVDLVDVLASIGV